MQKEAKTLEVEDVLYYKYCIGGKNKSDWLTAKKRRDGWMDSEGPALAGVEFGTSDEGNSASFVVGSFLFKFGFDWFEWFNIQPALFLFFLSGFCANLILYFAFSFDLVKYRCYSVLF